MARPQSPLTKFILTLPDLSPAEVVERAKAAGYATTRQNVSQARNRARTSNGANKPAAKRPTAKKTHARTSAPAKKPVKTGAPPAPAPVAAPKLAANHAAAEATSVGGLSSAEDLLRAVASEIGLARAIAVLEQQRRQVLDLLGH